MFPQQLSLKEDHLTQKTYFFAFSSQISVMLIQSASGQCQLDQLRESQSRDFALSVCRSRGIEICAPMLSILFGRQLLVKASLLFHDCQCAFFHTAPHQDKNDRGRLGARELLCVCFPHDIFLPTSRSVLFWALIVHHHMSVHHSPHDLYPSPPPVDLSLYAVPWARAIMPQQSDTRLSQGACTVQ